MPILSVTAFSRLHFGMFSFGNPQVRQFGGVGVMLQQPRLKLLLQPSEQFTIHHSVNSYFATRIENLTKTLVNQQVIPSRPKCTIRLPESIPQHSGLGSGTQLALAVVTGLLRFCGIVQPPLQQLVQLANRGKRSAVGSYGFSKGGLIVDAGKMPGGSFSPLKTRVEFPTSWRWVLVRLDQTDGKSGDVERLAFDRLPVISPQTTDKLEREAFDQMLPAVENADFDRFSQSLYRFGHTAGDCFADAQGGTFASPEIQQLINKLRSWNIFGVGQSSWGPTIFAITANQQSADQLVEKLRMEKELKAADITITATMNQPAIVECE